MRYRTYSLKNPLKLKLPMCKQKKMYKNVETTEHNKKRRKKARSTNIFYKVICWLTDTLVESADHYASRSLLLLVRQLFHYTYE